MSTNDRPQLSFIPRLRLSASVKLFDGNLVPSEVKVGEADPESVGIYPGAKISNEIYQERVMSLMSGGAKITLGKEHGSSKGIKQESIVNLGLKELVLSAFL